jgi:hypothetical protein
MAIVSRCAKCSHTKKKKSIYLTLQYFGMPNQQNYTKSKLFTLLRILRRNTTMGRNSGKENISQMLY